MTDTSSKRPVRLAILTISDTRTPENDTSGNALERMATEDGHEVVERLIVPDDIYRIRYEVSRWIIDPKVEAVITTGGTGLTGRDGTPEAVAPLLDRTIEGFGELFRWLSYQKIKTSTIASRAIGGVANGTFIFCLPGSTGACKDAWNGILRDQLDLSHRPCNLVELMPRLTES
ncbi:molybdenum cofactor biosynthesis protein B [endosymbiont of unidentified scaly snail isolate Monju]|uniref:molybdenum cofactor biosynthesis protein B n=1 Tax=endosymbiont of unidentified scaly snail isolate Monju TaxID=1248727 RepID=UPI0003892CD6|nr:molybdenum cofactor biosynthesis protein B [endosymbiont of unidentified scaly snail isolate Monju]BAN68292.1 molybdenum cofactor biosynthesis protein B [endosymbiont of unidentified scaly snail isolate Monju]